MAPDNAKDEEVEPLSERVAGLEGWVSSYDNSLQTRIATWASTFAVLLSFATAAYTIYDKEVRQIDHACREKAYRLTALALDFYELQTQQEAAYQVGFERGEQVASQLNTTRQPMLEEAKAILFDECVEVDAITRLRFSSYYASTQIETGLEVARQGLKVAKRPREVMLAHKALGEIYFQDRDFDAGRESFRKGLDFSDDVRPSYRTISILDTYKSWIRNEAYYGHCDQVRTIYQKILELQRLHPSEVGILNYMHYVMRMDSEKLKCLTGIEIPPFP